jgi:hypothetical protein
MCRRTLKSLSGLPREEPEKQGFQGVIRIGSKFSSGAGCKDFMPRKTAMPAPSAATAGSAALGFSGQYSAADSKLRLSSSLPSVFG